MRLPVIAQVGRIAPEDRAKLAVFLAVAPLYTSLDIPGTWLEQDNVENIVPAEIQHPCESTKCEDLGTPSWKLAPLAQNITPGFCGGLLYLLPEL